VVPRLQLPSAAALFVLMGGCVGDGAPTLTQSGEHDAFGGFDARVDFDALGPNDVAIGYFEADHRAVTRGVDQRGALVAGTVTLSWLTHAAGSVQITADGEPLALDACTPTGDDACAIAGSVTLSPAETRTYTLRAVGTDGTCGAVPCPERTLTVDVIPPAHVELLLDRPSVTAGVDLPVAYTLTNVASFNIGRVVGEDAPALDPCVPMDDATAGARCVLEPSGDVPLTERGVAVFLDVDRDLRVGATATNGAGDGLGDVALGDVTADVTVPVEVRRFDVSPPRALPGASVKLSWVVAGAEAVAVSAAPARLLGLDSCVGVNVEGTGYCTVQVAADAPIAPIALTLTARQSDERTGSGQASLGVISGPMVDRFEANPAAAVPGQAVLLSWEVYGADAVRLYADGAPVAGIESCTAVGPGGAGSCTVQVAPHAQLGSLALTLEATHTVAGPPDLADLDLDIGPAPEVVEAWVDDDTVITGGAISLHWVTEHAASVVVTEVSGALSNADLLACSGVDELGEGSCEIAVPVALPPGELALSVVARGPTGARSEATLVEVTVNGPPVVTFSASPELLPGEGGEATLSWTAVGADRIFINDDTGSGVRLVDTAEATACDSGANCVPLADAITVDVAVSTVWTLRASNAYGTVSVTARVRLDGAPSIEALSIGGSNLLSGNIITHQAEEGTLAWSLLGIDDGDHVSLERSPLPGRRTSCAAVAPEAWTLADGFPVTDATIDSVTISDLTLIAECFRFSARDTDAPFGQRDTTVFEVRKDPNVVSFTSDTATVAPGQDVTLTWATAFAYEVTVDVTPTGAATAEDLGACSAANGSCSVTIQPGTPLGEVVFSVAAVGDGDVASQPQTTLVDVGVAPTIVGFQATPASAAGPVVPTLSWHTVAGDRLVITEGDLVLLDTSDPALVAAGAQSAGPTPSTRSWHLTVYNVFGQATATTATFIGPSIDTLSVDGSDALDGAVTIVTGPMTVAWTTTNADGEQSLDVGPAPAGGSCAGAAYTTVFTTGDGQSSASHALGTVTDNRCVRLRVSNTATPPQTSVATFLLRERPELAAVSRSPSTIDADDDDVTLTMKVRGATKLAVTATYLTSNGTVLGSRDVCDQGSLSSGQLSGGAGVDTVKCVHHITACNILCLNSGMPAVTARVRYRVVVSDQEGDSASATMSDVHVD